MQEIANFSKHTTHTTHATRRPAAIVTAIVGLAFISACSSDSVGVGGSTQSQLSFSTSGTSSSNAVSAALVPVTVGAHTLDLTQVTLTIDRAELKRAHTDACAGDNDENDDHPGPGNSGNSGNTGNCAEVKIGPTTVDLPLTPGVVSIPANTIPAGTFRELELSVSQVRLKGTFDGTAFDVSLPVRVRQEVEFATPIVVTDSAPASVTVNVPVAGWLVNADGSLVDPSKILTTPSLMAAVKARIAASFRAFEDRDHDGKDDHGGRN